MSTPPIKRESDTLSHNSIHSTTPQSLPPPSMQQPQPQPQQQQQQQQQQQLPPPNQQYLPPGQQHPPHMSQPMMSPYPPNYYQQLPPPPPGPNPYYTTPPAGYYQSQPGSGNNEYQGQVVQHIPGPPHPHPPPPPPGQQQQQQQQQFQQAQPQVIPQQHQQQQQQPPHMQVAPPPQQQPPQQLQSIPPPGQGQQQAPKPAQTSPLGQDSKKRLHSQTQPTSRAAATYPRKRALTACDTCRLKKIKCDNVRPRCGSCIKNGNMNCHYRTDDQQKDYSSYDPASLNILSKLDVILKDLKDIKSGGSVSRGSVDSSGSVVTDLGAGTLTKKFTFDRCIWDMSLTSIMTWRSFLRELKETPEHVEVLKLELFNSYDTNNGAVKKMRYSLRQSLENYANLEKLIENNFSSIINSFFVNTYTKIPILDTYEFFDTLEKYQLLVQNLPDASFSKLVELYVSDDELPEEIQYIYQAQNTEITPTVIALFNRLIHAIPLILMVCALGIISVPVQLDNLTKYRNSQEEADSISVGCLSGPDAFKNIPDTFPRKRMAIAFMLKEYAQVLCSTYPYILKENSIVQVQYHLLVSQLYLQLNSILLAHTYNVLASRHMIYFLQKKKYHQQEFSEAKKDTIDRLFWTCLKLECELNVELSPFVPLSGITQVEPPTLFPKIPEPLSEETKRQYSDSVIKLAQTYDDQYTWYYFLTEIAVRKVDNKMFDELYSLESSLNHTWDTKKFSDEKVWTSFIKYLNQYNGIINSLSPEIRNFVLQEVNVDQIHRRMKRKYEKKQLDQNNNQGKIENDIFDSLDDFLIDDDLLVRAQSESIMYIKTRVIVSKLLLFRPIAYLFLEDKISFVEIIHAVSSVLEDTINTTSLTFNNLKTIDSPNSSLASGSFHLLSDTNSSDLEMDYSNLINAPLFYQKQHPDEDFSNLIDYDTRPDDDDDTTDDLESNFTIKNMPLARTRILRIFIQNLISLPKLNIPKLSTHRHPGLWYYLRNLIVGNVCQYFLYKKIQEMIAKASTDIELQSIIAMQLQSDKAANGEAGNGGGGGSGGAPKSMEELIGLINMVIDIKGLIASFEHCVIIMEYWKDEVKDCEIYQGFIKKILLEIQNSAAAAPTTTNAATT
ncbi:hypothetical protein Cantr_07216 [Candida viswanathii]|uniref:Zn(2)-C6 fungal-type domain-containing protein n=1 Tax=Candida viswanathii TaxID=5486 RepID=A0A367Y0I2_9ASCO|nr:hypothetical protein Cantr_07216 [Candida viswanathii]